PPVRSASWTAVAPEAVLTFRTNTMSLTLPRQLVCQHTHSQPADQHKREPINENHQKWHESGEIQSRPRRRMSWLR
ncbi:hypothetical protein, partial [Leekyejoonella antrihumi]|uniref:hypothetical protein n=1 Tax=Leekyejoonella antrihumi TaxID=1660198 RepID=UPI001C94F495